MNIQALVNSTLASFAATVRTDMDRGVVSTALEMLEDLLKFLRPFSFPLQERVTDSLVVSVQDVFEKKVYAGFCLVKRENSTGGGGGGGYLCCLIVKACC